MEAKWCNHHLELQICSSQFKFCHLVGNFLFFLRGLSKEGNYASFNSTCTQSPPPPGYCGAFARLVSPGVEHLQILHCLGCAQVELTDA